ncbi:MAG: hypothetical protein MI799_05070, partial [Desulfobacterales bacterium]|nr:hypothetical protein [Desulfobacterales bacterium]
MKLIRSKTKKNIGKKKSPDSGNDPATGIRTMDIEGAVDQKTWKMLIVDDEPDVHEITRIALKGFRFDGKRLELTSAYSVGEAKQILKNDQGFSVAMIDVVMETEEAGLDLV